ncbi:MAG: haloacid dehalogenase type II [Bauldia sp.]|nr:haloacid dehalogenase type II [Bauldia sp.]
MKLTDFSALTFDCYGTLIDWETGILAGLRPLAARTGDQLGDDVILAAFGRNEAAQEAETPDMIYSQLLGVVFGRIARDWGLTVTAEEAARFGASIPDWPAFPDTADALRYLKQHYKLGILSNVDRRSFAGSNQRLGVTFDWIMTAEDIGSYKPSPRNFEYMIETLARDGVEKAKILHTAESLFHDHLPANRFGLASCWIFRRHDKEGFGATSRPAEMPRIDFRFNSLGDMADAHRKETGGASPGT